MKLFPLRLVLLCLCLVTAAIVSGATPAPAPSSVHYLVRVHPGPWRPPSRVALAAMRFDPESGEVAAVPGGEPPAGEAALRARAEASVRRAPDGSLHAVLGGAFRRWTVATIDDRGRLFEDCLPSEAAARQRVEAATGRGVRK